MKILRSRTAASLAAIAVVTMSASPVLARDHWRPRHHHHRGGGIDGGDILAGLLVVGGIAAIATVASNANDRRDEVRNAPPVEPRYTPRNDQQQYVPPYDQQGDGVRYSYPGGPPVGSGQDEGNYAPDDAGDGTDQYGRDSADDYSPSERDYGEADVAPASAASRRAWGGAVDACTRAVEQGEARIDAVNNVREMGGRTAVDGRLADGRGFACSVDASGSVRSATIDDRGMV